ncbi:MAG TPA: hypothetical protein VKZ60_01035 [Chloroflexota bacterium]|nr:hypothetical protein [Chloroflexota bacterium]
MDAPTLAGRVVGIAVLVLGPLLQLVVNGPSLLGSFVFWFGLYGWLSAAIALGYVAYCIVYVVSPPRGAPQQA